VSVEAWHREVAYCRGYDERFWYGVPPTVDTGTLVGTVLTHFLLTLFVSAKDCCTYNKV